MGQTARDNHTHSTQQPDPRGMHMRRPASACGRRHLLMPAGRRPAPHFRPSAATPRPAGLTRFPAPEHAAAYLAGLLLLGCRGHVNGAVGRLPATTHALPSDALHAAASAQGRPRAHSRGPHAASGLDPLLAAAIGHAAPQTARPPRRSLPPHCESASAAALSPTPLRTLLRPAGGSCCARIPAVATAGMRRQQPTAAVRAQACSTRYAPPQSLRISLRTPSHTPVNTLSLSATPLPTIADLLRRGVASEPLFLFFLSLLRIAGHH